MRLSCLLEGEQFSGSLFRDVGLDADEVHHSARRVSKWRNEEIVPERSSILAVVKEDHVAIGAIQHCFANLIDRVWVGRRALQEAAVVAQYLARRVPAELEEAARGEHDRVVLRQRIRDDKMRLCLSHDMHEGEVGCCQFRGRCWLGLCRR